MCGSFQFWAAFARGFPKDRAVAIYNFRGLICTKQQFHALRQIEQSDLRLPQARISAESVGDERRIKLAFADGHDLAIRPDGTPA